MLITILGIILIKESLNLLTNHPIIFALIIVVIILLSYYIYTLSKKKSYAEEIKNEIEEEEELTVDDDEELRSVPDNFNISNEKVMIGSVTENGAVEEVKIVNYEYFTKVIHDKEFLNKFRNSMILNYKLKKKTYVKLYHETKSKLDILGREGFKVNHVGEKAETINSLKSTLKEIEEILKCIKEKQKDLTIEKVKENILDALHNPNDGLDTLIGREEVKDHIAERLYTFAMNPRIFSNNFQHILLYGRSGFGKSKTGEVIAYVYSKSGILVRNRFMLVTKVDFTTPFVNSAGQKTRDLLLSNLEGVLLLDEAYDLSPPLNGHDHTNEAITALVNFMTEMKGLNIVIAAGYEDDMKERFMKSNQGLPRRFPHVMTLRPFKSEDLTKICLSFLRKLNPVVSISQKDANLLFSIISKLNNYHLKHKGKDLVFEHQSGAMENIASNISQMYYTMLPKSDMSKAIKMGINKYLKEKNICVNINFEEIEEVESEEIDVKRRSRRPDINRHKMRNQNTN